MQHLDPRRHMHNRLARSHTYCHRDTKEAMKLAALDLAATVATAGTAVLTRALTAVAVKEQVIVEGGMWTGMRLPELRFVL